VLDPTHGADYTIWIVAALLYVSDAAKLLSPRQLLLVEARRGKFAAAFSATPYTLAGRVLSFAPLLQPHRGVFVAPWGSVWTDGARLTKVLESIERLRRSLRGARVLAIWAFLLLFAVGPALTLSLGTAAAILVTAAALYPTVIVAIAYLCWRRRALRLTIGRSVGLSLEILVCPAFLPNLVRKITTLESIQADGAQVLVATAAADVKTEFLSRLESRTEELIEEIGPDDPAQADLRAYLAAVRGAR
jgi:hypothetical protein